MSGNRPRVPLVVRRNNTRTPRTVTSVLAGAHQYGEGYLSGLTTKNAMKLRAISSEMRNAITSYPWADLETPVTRNVAGWYANFPNAKKANFRGYVGGPRKLEQDARVVRLGTGGTLLDFLHGLDVILVDEGPVIVGSLVEWKTQNPQALAANIRNRRDLSDADFAHLAGVHTLEMSWCDQATITDAAFAHIAGVHTLNMALCNQATITDAAFAHIAGVHTLDMSYCPQETITDAAFAHIAGVHTLNMMECYQETITDAAFAHIAGVHTLNMAHCAQAGITDAALQRIAGVETIDISFCTQLTVTGVNYLVGTKEIITEGCSPEVIYAAARLLRRGGKRNTRSRKILKKRRTVKKNTRRRRI